MRYILSLVFFAGLYSCGGNAGVVKKLKGCDSLVITFNAPNSDSVISSVNTTETKAIQKLAGFMKGKETELFKCGYDGNMLFFKGGVQVLPVVFKFSEKGCETFVYDLDNKVISTSMSNEAVNFLRSLSEGKSWY